MVHYQLLLEFHFQLSTFHHDSLPLWYGLPTSQTLNQAAGDVADCDVTFLDTLRVIRRNIQEKINLAGELPTRAARKSHQIGPASSPGFGTS
jgi:hypothetical protein